MLGLRRRDARAGDGSFRPRPSGVQLARAAEAVVHASRDGHDSRRGSGHPIDISRYRRVTFDTATGLVESVGTTAVGTQSVGMA